MVSWVRGRLGRVALREAAVMVDAAFGIFLGDLARSPKYEALAAPATWNDWNGSGNRPHIPISLHSRPVAASASCYSL